MKKVKLNILLLLFLGMSASGAQQSQPPSVLKSESGRFVFGQIGPARADQYLLDTENGRLWQVVVNSEGVVKLQPVRFYHVLGNEAYLPESYEQIKLIDEMTRDAFYRNKQKNK